MARHVNKTGHSSSMCFGLLTLFSLSLYAGCASCATDISVDAMGSTQEQAIKNAILSASEQVSGVMVISDQRLDGDRLTRDVIRQHTAGIVNSYEVVGCQSADKLYTCLINAKVSPMPLRLTTDGGGKDLVVVSGSSADAEVKTYARSVEEGRTLTLTALSEWQQSLKASIKSTRIQPNLSGKPVMEITYRLENEPGFFKYLQAILERVEKTNAKINEGVTSNYHRGNGVDKIILDAPEIGWWPRFYFLNDPVLSRSIAEIDGMLAMLKVEVNLLGRDGIVLATGCDTVRSDFVIPRYEMGYRILEFKVGRPQDRQISFAVAEAQLPQLMGVQVSMGCSSRGDIKLIGQAR